MRIDVVTLFPQMPALIAECGITSRAAKLGLWQLKIWNPRRFTHDAHRTVDDRPFGGGPGMVMMSEPLAQTIDAIRADGNRGRVFAFAPSGRTLCDERVLELAESDEDMILVCGRYEGIDQRFLDTYVDEIISIGDYVLSGGELAAMVLMDAVVRRLPGAIKELSASDESFSTGLLDAPHYTRPEEWRGMKVPEVLVNGHHKHIQDWTRKMALQTTATNRPDLVKIARSKNLLSEEDEKVLRTLSSESSDFLV
ncbi:tRNA (guanosine(37)-N1)-methyltransferase TrmD [uncultured Parasutterella sp.]|uniref:tRNA (guanosine(37)-N1)-methyltransferase TrmD n=1 Tax=uncultured Parasutterella sp. TaxID=1263098 RepID=UPI0025B4AB6B|nr:tRNA (guanosine(37)-N1)-methyltransferase TrmD [uncultured Parasutterella sp.]